MMDVEVMLLALGIAIIRPLFAFAMMSLAGPWQVPWPIQIALAVILGLFVMPHIDVATFTSNPIAVLPMLGVEALIGMAIGFVLQLAIAAAKIGGELVSSTIGMGFAQMVDPEHGHTVPTIGQFMGLLAVAVFMAMDGHVMMVRILTDSYTALPPGGAGLSQQAIWSILKHGNTMFAAGFMMALPVIAATLVVQLAMAVAARMAPALNLLAVGMPAMLIGGLFMLTLTVPVISDGARSTLTASFRLAAGIMIDGTPARFVPMLAQMLPMNPAPVATSITPAQASAASKLLFNQREPKAEIAPNAAKPIVNDMPVTRITAFPGGDRELAIATTAIEGLTPVPQIGLEDHEDRATAETAIAPVEASAAGTGPGR